MPKTVEMELAEADRMHGLAVRMRKQGDTSSADALENKVRTKRKKAIGRMGRRPKNPNTRGRPPATVTAGRTNTAIKVS